MSDILIRKATEKDLEAIHELAVRIWNRHYPGIISNAQIAYMLNKSYTTKALKEQLDGGQQFYLISRNEIPLGYAAVEESSEDILLLHKLYCDTAAGIPGLGTLLYSYVERHYPGKKVQLRVNRNNQRAIRFYIKTGFAVVAENDLPIGDGFVMEDYIMEKQATL